jgi:phosphoglycolate phosphatase
MREPGTRVLPVDAILFDLDGTLADTAGDLVHALNRVRRDRGLEPVTLEALRAHASAGARGLIGAGMGVGPGDADYPDLRDAFLAHYEACLAETTRLFDGVADLLDELDARRLPWGIVTNKASRFTRPLVAALGLADRVATVVSGDTTPHPKPRPEPLVFAAREMGVDPSRCAYVGDDLRDIAAGNAAGMATLVARWGYLGTGEPHDRWPATGGADDPIALLAWLPPAPRTA